MPAPYCRNGSCRYVRAVDQWLWLRAFQTVHYRTTLKITFHFFTHFLAKFLSNFFKIIILYYFLFFYNLKRIKSNSLLTVWYALRPIQHTTVSLNYSQSIKINIGSSDIGTIIPSTHRPTVLYWRLLDFQFSILHWSHPYVLKDSNKSRNIYHQENYFHWSN